MFGHHGACPVAYFDAFFAAVFLAGAFFATAFLAGAFFAAFFAALAAGAFLGAAPSCFWR